MDMDMSEYLDEFVKELHQLLDTFEIDLEKISTGKEDKDIIDEIFRAAHSIKGMSAAMEFKNMETLTHRMEDLLDKIRNHEQNINTTIIEVLYKGVKILNELLKSIEYSATEDDVEQNLIDKEVDELDVLLGKEKKEIKNEENKNKEVNNGLFDETIVLQVEKAISKNNPIFLAELSVDENSPLMTARAFMVVSSIKSSEELIASIPKPDSFTNPQFELENNKIQLLFISDKILEDLNDSLKGLPEITNVNIKTIDSTNDLNLEFINNNNTKVNKTVDIDIFSQFDTETELLDFLNKQITSIEIAAIDFSGKNYSDFFKQVFNEYELVCKGIQMVESKSIGSLAGKSLDFITQCQNYEGTSLNDDCLDIFLDILTYMRKFCENRSVIDNRIFKGRIAELEKKFNKIIALKNIDSDEKIGTILQKQLNMSENDINELLEKQKTEYKGKKLGEVAVAEHKISSKDVISALKVQKAQKKTDVQREQIRIPADKADQLIDLLEELIMVESETEQDAIGLAGEDSKLIKNINKSFRITKEIQNLSISFRMITLHSIFQKVNMSARDAMKKLGKKVKIDISGAQTNIDRLVGNKIVDPLLHLIKNSISHGIESEEDRVEAGKPKEGHIYINAYSEKGYVYISIADDGRGMDTDKLYNKALDKGLIDPNKKFSEDEILNFIFLPGFSTAEKINKISGRGVGMDVVKTEIQKLRGKISVSNRPGKGCTTVLRIPQNMTSLNGTVVKIKGNKYIIPSIHIKEVFKLEKEKFVSVSGNDSFVKLRDTIIPVINRDIFFQGEGAPEIMVVLDVDSCEKALPIDQVMERREIVVKPLGEDFEDIKYISGASILGDGRAALILGIENLFKLSDEQNCAG